MPDGFKLAVAVLVALAAALAFGSANAKSPSSRTPANLFAPRITGQYPAGGTDGPP